MSQKENQTLRLFIGCSLEACWPQEFPSGKLLTTENRHITLAFIGDVTASRLPLLNKAPKPKFSQRPQGIFDKILPLPCRRPTALTYHA